MSLFWLAYRQKAATCVMIVEASYLVAARIKAALANPGIDDHFVRAVELPDGQAVPAQAIGRLLTQEEAQALLKQLERGIPKKRAAPSVRRQAQVRRAVPK